MNKRIPIAGCLLLVAGLSGCEHMSNTAKGGLIGAGVGTGVGALAGSATGNTRAGAAIGGIVGTGIGMIAGNDADQEEKRRKESELRQTRAELAAANARPTQPPLGITDVQQLAASGVGDAVIINQIRSTGSSFQLSPTDIQWLKTNGVSDGVILEMQNARPRAAAVSPPTRTIIREEPTTVIYTRPRPPVYVYDPWYAPPPPPSYGVGVVIRR